MRKQERVNRICNFTTTERRNCSSRTILNNSHTDPVHHRRIELDSHADTIVFGRNCAVIHFMGRECDVSLYTDAYKLIKTVRIACAGTAWTSSASEETYILVFNVGLCMGDKMDDTLINPNQLHHFRTKVQDNPYDYAPLYLKTEDGDFVLPLSVQGTSIMADTCTPNEEELQTCKHITLLSQHPWYPHRVRFPQTSRTVQEEVEMLCTIGSISVDRSNDKESAEENVIMNHIMHQLISSL